MANDFSVSLLIFLALVFFLMYLARAGERARRRGIVDSVLIPSSSETFSKDEVLQELMELSVEDLIEVIPKQDRYCYSCGECCKNAPSISFSKEDLAEIAEFFHLSQKDLLDGLDIKWREDIEQFLLPANPCPFLDKNNLCKIYKVRPFSCKSYPIGVSIYRLTEKEGLPLQCPALRDIVSEIVVRKRARSST